MMDRHDASTNTEERTGESGTQGGKKGDNKDKAKTVTHGQKPEGSKPRLLFKFIHIEKSLVAKTKT